MTEISITSGEHVPKRAYRSPELIHYGPLARLTGTVRKTGSGADQSNSSMITGPGGTPCL
jgi:hypothetical protein